MLDAYFYCGAVTGGATLGLGLMARALPEGTDTDAHVRGGGGRDRHPHRGQRHVLTLGIVD